jgi:hypothetical protein
MIRPVNVKGFVTQTVQRYVREQSQKSTGSEVTIMGKPHEIKILDRAKVHGEICGFAAELQ